MRRSLAAALLPLAFLPTTPARAAVPVVFVDGRGFGHGVGMAQDGALAMGRAGATTAAILAQFYPGTAIGQGTGTVRVVVHTSAGSELVVSFPGGGEVRDAPSGAQSAGFPLKVAAGEQVRLRTGGGTYSAEVLGGSAAGASPPGQPSTGAPLTSSSDPGPSPPGGVTGPAVASQESTTTTAPSATLLPPPPSSSTTTTAPPPPPPSSSSTTAPPPPSGGSSPTRRATSTRPLWSLAPAGSTVAVPARGRQYRDGLEATAAGGPFRLVNHVAVETYLKGMGEVRDPSWPQAALRAQAIAARTYALRATAAGAELCDDQRCQVYLGAQAEYPAMSRAVNESAGQVVTYNRRLASAVYSANAGGHSATPEEGFGTTGTDFPYLRAATYPSQDQAPWSVTVALSDVATRLGYPGQVTDVRIGRTGPSSRAVDVVLDGTAGPKTVTGLAFDANLGLRSTLFSLRVGTSDTAPPPPGQESLLQLPPDAVAAATTGTVSAVPTLPGAPAPPAVEASERAGVGLVVGSAAAALVAAVGSAATVAVRRHHRHRWAHLRRRRGPVVDALRGAAATAAAQLRRLRRGPGDEGDR